MPVTAKKEKKEDDIHFKLTPSLHKRLYKKAQSLGMNKSQYIRYAVIRLMKEDS